jgi:hypothetical protein
VINPAFGFINQQYVNLIEGFYIDVKGLCEGKGGCGNVLLQIRYEK